VIERGSLPAQVKTLAEAIQAAHILSIEMKAQRLGNGPDSFRLKHESGKEIGGSHYENEAALRRVSRGRSYGSIVCVTKDLSVARLTNGYGAPWTHNRARQMSQRSSSIVERFFLAGHASRTATIEALHLVKEALRRAYQLSPEVLKPITQLIEELQAKTERGSSSCLENADD
jgi:hypothetical protein